MMLDEAIPPSEQAIRLSPDDPSIGVGYSQIGLAHLLQSRTDEAILWLEKSRSALPDRPVAHAWLAAAYGLNGDTGRAAAELAEARRLGADDRYSSIAHLRAAEPSWNGPKVRAKVEATFFAGLRLGGCRRSEDHRGRLQVGLPDPFRFDGARRFVRARRLMTA